MDDDGVFRALADASRRLLLDRLHARNGQTLGDLCQGMEMSRQAVAKHLSILEEARKHGMDSGIKTESRAADRILEALSTLAALLNRTINEVKTLDSDFENSV